MHSFSEKNMFQSKLWWYYLSFILFAFLANNLHSTIIAANACICKHTSGPLWGCPLRTLYPFKQATGGKYAFYLVSNSTCFFWRVVQFVNKWEVFLSLDLQFLLYTKNILFIPASCSQHSATLFLKLWFYSESYSEVYFQEIVSIFYCHSYLYSFILKNWTDGRAFFWKCDPSKAVAGGPGIWPMALQPGPRTAIWQGPVPI